MAGEKPRKKQGRKKKTAAQKAVETEIQLEMTSMIDVVFLLIIFFVLTLKFIVLEGQLSSELPKDVGLSPAKAEPELNKFEIKIYKDENNKIWYAVGNKDSTDSKDSLYRLAYDFRSSFPDKPALLNPHPDVPYEGLVLALDVCKKARFKSVQFTGLAEEPKKKTK